MLTQSGSGQSSTPAPYLEAGYELNTDGNAFAYYQTESANFAGSTGLFALFPGATTLTKVDGGLFDLTSINLAPIFDGSAPDPLTFTGVRNDLSMVVQTFTASSTLVFQPFVFGSSFSNLVSVGWNETALAPQYDHIVVAAALVPEPSSLILAGAGLLACIAGQVLVRLRI